MASLFEILKKGATTAQQEPAPAAPGPPTSPQNSYSTTQPAAQIYKYTTNSTNVGTHQTRVNSGVSVWQTNPASFTGALDQTDSTGLTDYSLFDTGWDGWTATGEGSTGPSWTRYSGGTPTSDTGPTHAVTGSYYVYTEIDGATSQTFSLQKSISISDELACISFYYFMYGSGMGTLYVDVKIGSVWTNIWYRVGQQHGYTSTGYGGTKKYQLEPYENVALYLSNYDGVISSPTINSSDIISVRFRYTATGSTLGDCAIDSIALSYNPFTVS